MGVGVHMLPPLSALLDVLILVASAWIPQGTARNDTSLPVPSSLPAVPRRQWTPLPPSRSLGQSLCVSLPSPPPAGLLSVFVMNGC